MQELLQLNEGAFKRAIEEVIENAINHAPIGKASYETAVRIMVDFAKKNDYRNVLAGCSDEEIEDNIKAFFPKEDHIEINEEEDSGDWPKIIAKADEFRVEVDADEQVHLLDGEDTVRVSMPLVIWKQLAR